MRIVFVLTNCNNATQYLVPQVTKSKDLINPQSVPLFATQNLLNYFLRGEDMQDTSPV